MRSTNRILGIGICWFLAVWLFFLLFLPDAPASAQTIAATVTVGSGPGAVAVNTATGKIYVGDSNGTVTVIDGVSNATSTVTVGIGPGPSAVAVNSVTNKIYVANRGNILKNPIGSITVIDGATNTTTTLSDPNARLPNAVAVNPLTNKIYVANSLSSNITVIDGATNNITTVSDPNASGLDASAVAVNPVTNKIYVANNNIDRSGNNPGNITVIDGPTNSTATVSDPNAISPVSLAVNPVTNKIYVANMGAFPATNHGNVTVLDGATNSTTTVTDPNALAPGGPDSRGFAVAVDSTTNKIYVGNEGSHNVTVIDGATNSTATVTDPNALAPVAVAVDSATNTIYVANGGCLFLSGCSNPGSVTVMSGVTNSVTTVIDPSANTPNAVAINALTNKIYVTNLISHNVTVIDGSAAPTTHTLSVLQAGSGSGTVTSNPTGIDCGASCSASFATGTVVILAASPASGSGFSGWGTACTGTNACHVMMTSDDFVTATFTPPDFSLQPASGTLTVQPGGQITDVIAVAPLNGISFGSAIQLSCTVTGTSPMPTCALSPSSVTPGANSVTSTLTITAPALSSATMPSNESEFSGSLYAVCLPFSGLAVVGCGLASGKSKNRRRIVWLLACLTLALVSLQLGCGGGPGTTNSGGGNNNQGTQPQNYTVTITATSGAIQHETQVTVMVP